MADLKRKHDQIEGEVESQGKSKQSRIDDQSYYYMIRTNIAHEEEEDSKLILMKESVFESLRPLFNKLEEVEFFSDDEELDEDDKQELIKVPVIKDYFKSKCCDETLKEIEEEGNDSLYWDDDLPQQPVELWFRLIDHYVQKKEWIEYEVGNRILVTILGFQEYMFKN